MNSFENLVQEGCRKKVNMFKRWCRKRMGENGKVAI